MNLTIENLQKIIQDSENLKSKLPTEIAQKVGMSSQKIRHLLNNLCALDNIKYLNIGLCGGSTFWSAIYNNNVKATGIDSWQDQNREDIVHNFWRNLSEVMNKETQIVNREIHIYMQDCFTVELKDKYNIYMYDAGHTENDQYRAITYFDKYLEDEFLLIVDDWDDIYVKKGTMRGLEEMKYNIKFIWEGKGVFGDWRADSNHFWNGLLVALISKK
jgi:hypothetical protein